MRKLFFLSMLALLHSTSLASALSERPYITKDDIDIATLLPSPPVETSPAGQLDLQIVKDLQANMTPERAKAIRDDLAQDVYSVAGSVLGPNFTKENFPL